jgi:hypothetical protein
VSPIVTSWWIDSEHAHTFNAETIRRVNAIVAEMLRAMRGRR